MKYLLLIIPVLLLSSCTNREQAENYCIDRGMVLYDYNPNTNDIGDTICESKYEVCIRKIRFAFEDLSDTWGNNTNNQDSISKTMSAEVDKCLLNIK